MSLRLKMFKQLYCNCLSIFFFTLQFFPFGYSLWKWNSQPLLKFGMQGGDAVHKHTAVREQLLQNCPPFSVYENGNGGSIHFFQDTGHVLCWTCGTVLGKEQSWCFNPVVLGEEMFYNLVIHDYIDMSVVCCESQEFYMLHSTLIFQCLFFFPLH